MGCGNSQKDANQHRGQKYKPREQEKHYTPNKDPIKGEFLQLGTPTQQRSVNDLFNSNAASVENINKFYKLKQLLGHGAYGTVQLAYLNSNLSQKFAVKTVVKDSAKDKLYMLRRQLEILKTLDHPNIIKFYEIYHDEMYVHFVMEYCDGGDLYQQLKVDGAFSEAQVAQIMKKIFSAVIYMHSKDIVHRDIKPDNILYTTQGPDAQLQLIDFGLSRQFKQDELFEQPSTVGTPMYAAPEVIEEQIYDQSCDNWSLGVMMYVLLTGLHPFEARDLKELFQEITKAHYQMTGPEWNDISKEAQDLVKLLMHQTPSKRIQLEDAISHRWFNMFPETKVVQEINELKLRKIKNRLDNVITNTENSLLLKQQAVKILVNHHLKDEDIQNLKNAFQTLDKDGNGQISFFEMQEAMKKLGMESSQKQIVKVFQTIHGNDSISDPKQLKLDYGQFIQAAIDLKTILDTEQMWRLFQEFDSKGKNYITKEDVRDLLAREGRKVSEIELQKMVDQFDTTVDKSGQITFEMFCNVLKHQGVEKDNSSIEDETALKIPSNEDQTKNTATDQNENQNPQEEKEYDDDLMHNQFKPEQM